MGGSAAGRKVLIVFGTRPEAIKMAPVVRTLRTESGWTTRLAVTAQHRELLDQVLSLFDLQPDYDLNLMQARQTLEELTSRVLLGMTSILARERPDLVLVHGDTTTTFAASLAAFYAQIPVGHVEAGLRSGKRYAPFPEELNRRLTGVLAELHFAPTPGAQANLLREGIPSSQIFITGNTVIDALLWAAERAAPPRDPELAVLLARSPRLLLVEAHRRESWGEPLREICLAIRELTDAFPDTEILFSVHPNPAVHAVVEEVLGGCPRVHLLTPQPYESWVYLMQHATLILTDSGGMQEEAPALGKPVVVLREVTERPEGVAAGILRLAGASRARIVETAGRLLRDEAAYQEMVGRPNPYGDGQASQRILEAIRYFFGESAHPPAPFQTVV